MATMTIAQAQASNQTGIIVVDTLTNIVNGLRAAPTLVDRVATFNMSANSPASLIEATLLARTGKFSANGFRLNVLGTIADLGNDEFAEGFAIATVRSAIDTADHLIAAAGTPLAAQLNGTVLSASAAVSLSGYVAMAGLPAFSVTGGQSITISDTAQNLLAYGGLAAGLKRPAVRHFTVTTDSTVSIAQAQALSALPDFSVSATLIVATDVAGLLTNSATATGLSAIPRVVVEADDTLENLLSSSAAIGQLRQNIPSLRTRMTDSPTVSAAQAATAAGLPAFAPADGQILTVADTMGAILGMSEATRAQAGAIRLTQTATATAAQANALAALSGFALADGVALHVVGNLAELTTLSTAALAVLTDARAIDTVAHIVAAVGLPAHVSAVEAQIDGGTYTIAQAQALLDHTNGVQLVLVGSNENPRLRIVDTLAHMNAAPAVLDALEAAGPVSAQPSDVGGTVDVATALSLLATPGFSPAVYDIAVADIGANLSANAGRIFGQGFRTITVTSGVLTAGMDDLLDPALRFVNANSVGAELASDASVTVAVASALVALPHFARGSGVALTLRDTVAHILSAGSVLSAASDVDIQDGGVITAGTATALAQVRATIGSQHFVVSGAPLVIRDTVANIVSPANGSGVSLASAIMLSTSSIVDAHDAAILAALGPSFSPGGRTLLILDTAANLSALAATWATAVNEWRATSLLSDAATVSWAQASNLARLAYFVGGANDLTIQDQASVLALHASSAVLVRAAAVLPSESAQITAAEANALAGIPHFHSGQSILTVVDTPMALATLTSMGAGLSGGQRLAPQATPNDAGFTISVSVLNTLRALPALSAQGYQGVVTLSDTADALASIASLFGQVSAGSILSVVHPVLAADAVTTASVATAIARMAGLALGGHTLVIQDDAMALATLARGTAAIASSVVMAHDAVVSAAQLSALASLQNFTTGGHSLVLRDTAAALLSVDQHALSFVTMASLSLGDVVSAAQATTLAHLPAFSNSGQPVTIVDTVTHILDRTGPSSPLVNDDGLAIASSIRLSEDATVTTAQANLLASFGSRFDTAGHTLTVTGTAGELLSSDSLAGRSIGAQLRLADTSVTVDAATASSLAHLPGFNKASTVLTISDTAQHLVDAAFADGIGMADHLQLSLAGTLGVADARLLIGNAAFVAGANGSLRIVDSLANLLTLANAQVPNHQGLLAASPIGLSQDILATTSQLQALAALSQSSQGGFTANGHSIVVMDSAKRIAAFQVPQQLGTVAYHVVGDAVLTAAQATALADRGAVLGDSEIIVADTPEHLLEPNLAAGLALATSVLLSADASVSVSDATLLFSDSRFDPGSHRLTVQGTPAEILGMASRPGHPVDAFRIASSQTVTVGVVQALEALGSRLSLGQGVTLTVSDTASALATLQPRDTALAAQQQLMASETVSTATAEALALLPHFSLPPISSPPGVTMTIEGSVVDLIGLSASARALVADGSGRIRTALPTNAQVTLTVADATELAIVPAFQVGNATITVRDTIAHLAGLSWSSVSSQHEVVDTIANLVANSSSTLLAQAHTVMPSGDSVIDVSAAVVLAGLPHFTTGDTHLTVTDHASDIANHVSEVLTVASVARLIDSAPITAAQAEALVPLSATNKLSVPVGLFLVVADTYANLTQIANGDGVALATRIEVQDSLANILTAAGHDWGSVQPRYVATSGGTVTSAQAGTLAALGSRLDLNGHSLVVHGDAASVLSHAADIAALHASAQVTDAAAAIGANAAGLLALGGTLTAVTITDSNPMGAAAAAGVAPFAAKLTNAQAVIVGDNAAHVAGVLDDLILLGSRLGRVDVTDSAANVAAHVGTASGIEDLGTLLNIHLTGTSPITAAAAATLWQVHGNLSPNSSFSILDAPSNIASVAGTLNQFGSTLVHVTLANTTVTISNVLALFYLAGRLTSPMDVDTNAVQAAGNRIDLGRLVDAGAVASININGEDSDQIAAHVAALLELATHAPPNHVGAIVRVSILDSAGDVATNLDALHSLLGGNIDLTTITLSDQATPNLVLSIAQFGSDMDVVARIVSPFNLRVSDTAQHLQADLEQPSSILVMNRAAIAEVSVSQGATIELSVARLTASGMDDGSTSLLAKLVAGTVRAVGVHVGDISGLTSLTVAPEISIQDTGANIQTDLASNGSAILGYLAVRPVVAVASDSVVYLTLARLQAITADADEAHVLQLLGSSLGVTGLAIADVATAMALQPAPSHLRLVGTGSDIATDLGSNASQLLAHRGLIDEISVPNATILTISAVADLTAHVNDAATSVLGRIVVQGGGNLTLVVTDVGVASIDAVAAGYVTPQMTVSDTDAHVSADLALGVASHIVGHQAGITSIAFSSNTSVIAMTAAQFMETGVATALAKIQGQATFSVTQATVADLDALDTALGALAFPLQYQVSDTAMSIQTDLVAGNASSIDAHLASIQSIAVTDADPVTLTTGEFAALGGDGATVAALLDGHLVVTGVSVADFLAMEQSGVLAHANVTVVDTMANIQADLALANSHLFAQRTHVSQLVSTLGATLTLNEDRVLAAGMNTGVDALISRLAGPGNATIHLSVEAATVGHLNDLYAGAVLPDSVDLTDTPAAIATDLDLPSGSRVLGHIADIGSIAISGNGQFNLSATRLLNTDVQDALTKITFGGTPLRATGTTVTQISQVLAAAVVPNEILVADTASNIQSDLTGNSSVIRLNLTGAHAVTAISVTDNQLVSLTMPQLEESDVDDGPSSAVARLGADHVRAIALSLDGAIDPDSIERLANLHTVPHHLTVQATAAQIATDIASGGASQLMTWRQSLDLLQQSDQGTIDLTAAVALAANVNDGPTSILAKTRAPNNASPSLTVSGLTVQEVGSQLGGMYLSPTAITIQDSAANLSTDLASGVNSAVLSHLGQIGASGITQGIGNIQLTMSQFNQANVAATLHKVQNLHLEVSQALVADIATIQAEQFAGAVVIDVRDSAANIAADLAAMGNSKLLSLSGLGTITVAPAGTIDLTYAQFTQAGTHFDDQGSIYLSMTGATLNVSGVDPEDIADLLGNSAPVHPDTLQVLGTAATILQEQAAITNHAGVITSVKPSESTLTVADATQLYDLLAGITTFDESGLTIEGSLASLLVVHANRFVMLSSAAHVHMTDDPAMTVGQANAMASIAHFELTSNQPFRIFDSATNLLAAAQSPGMELATIVTMTGTPTVSASQATILAGLHGFRLDDSNNQNPATLTIIDTVANILAAGNAAGTAAATVVEPNGDITVTAAQLTALHAITGFSNGGHHVTIQDSVANILAMGQAARDEADTIIVSDTAAHVAGNLNALQAALAGHGYTFEIHLTDGVSNTQAIAVSGTTYHADREVIDAITTTGTVTVTGSAADLATDANALHGSAAVGRVIANDSATNILSNLTTLQSIGSKFGSAQLTDNTITAVQAAGLFVIPNVTGTSVIADTADQIANALTGNNAAAIRTFMNARTVRLTDNSEVSAAQTAAILGVTSLDKDGHTLKLWDFAQYLTSSTYVTAVSAPFLDGVFLRAIGNSATVSAAVAAALVSINGFSKDTPAGVTNTLTVQGTAAAIETYYGALSSHRPLISNIVVNASSTISDAVYGHLLSLGATLANNMTLTVRDTASVIASNAPIQIQGSPSLVPTAWLLQGSATITAPQAIVLGGLQNFQPGGFTLTLSANAAGLSVSDANAIAALGNAFALGGKTLGIAGDVATLQGLQAGARAIVTPAITDTFAHIAGLTLQDNLHRGTFTITDSGTVTTSQANAFLTLLKVGNGPGIPVSNVNFSGHVEAVNDTLANIQTLTNSSGWASNPSVHDDFSLVVADSVAVLVAGNNTAALAAMAGTTFSGNQTTTAASAQLLYTLKDTIKFTKGAFTLTVEDTAAHLADPTYIDGLAFAETWQLSANAVVTAAVAEALLAQMPKFQLNHVLTISDSSDNLLDGTLVGLLPNSPNIVVQLASAETLLAGQAAELVALHGFSNSGGAMTIQDTSTYLLDSANAAAEAAATSVTLAGDETLSILTTEQLVALPHFDIGTATISLAANDYADAAALEVVANLGSQFDSRGLQLTLTEDALDLTPAQWLNLQDDNLVLNGHHYGAVPLVVSVTYDNVQDQIEIHGTGLGGATLNIYTFAAPNTVAATQQISAGTQVGFVVETDEDTAGGGIILTETKGGTGESAPIIAIERDTLANAVTAANATFATTGSIMVDNGQYVDLVSSDDIVPSPAHPVLVYNPTSHTLALHISGQNPLTLVTLGTTTTPDTLDAGEIFVRHFG